MIKVLLAFEDFNELTLTESYLKRVGFDVVGISNEILLQDHLLAFNPDIVVANGKNSRVSSFSIGQKMKENHRYQGKVVIVVPKDVRPEPQEIIKMKMDGIIEAPLMADKLIQVLCRLANQDPQGYLDKLQKSKFNAPEVERRFMVSGLLPGEVPPEGTMVNSSPAFPSQVPLQDSERIKKYERFTQGIQFDIKQSTHSRADLREKQKELKKDWNFDELEDQDELKRQFAEALFKKK